jgi:predicted nucleic acid-binding protein
MARIALDTNGYVEILRGGPRAAAIRDEMAAAHGGLYVLMPVVMELLQGARSTAEARTLRQRLMDPVPEKRRVVATPAEWAGTGDVVAAMARGGHDKHELTRRAFWLDLHIAVLCRTRGITLLTDDGDHDRIEPYVYHRTEPLPS